MSSDPPDKRFDPAEGPPDPVQPLARASLARHKRRDMAAILPVAALLLFASPLLDLVAGAGTLAGLPVAVLYVFGTWFALVGITARLARRLIRDEGET